MNKYIQAIKRMNNALNPVLNFYKKPKFYFFIKALFDNIIYGVTPNEYIGFGFYKKSSLEKRTFFTARMQKSIERKLNSPLYHDVFWKKHLFNTKFSKWIKRDWIYTPDVNKECIEEFINSHNKVIIKPIGGSSGKGIHVYKNDSIEELCNGEYLLESFIQQHSVLSSCNPSSVNTIRIYTILDTKNNPHILSTSLRCGGDKAEVDNFHSGGVGYPIDPATGYICSPGKNIVGDEFIIHPSSNKKMIGLEIPNWDKLLDFVYSAACHIPEARFIAWDVAVLEDDFEMIEANYMGDPGFMQTPTQQGKLYEIKKYM